MVDRIGRMVAGHLKNKQETYGLISETIERDETRQLIAWLDAPFLGEKLPVAVLSGNPGLGKSVILKQLYQKLRERGTLVLGIKADGHAKKSSQKLAKSRGQKLGKNQRICRTRIDFLHLPARLER